MSILVLCPTRGRPEAVHEAANSLIETRRHGSTQLVAVIDHDDPGADVYVGQANSSYEFMFPVHSGGMVAALNAAAMEAIEKRPEVSILGFVGDDHRFRTQGWDEVITDTLRRPGYAYAYDGFWHKGEIPTQIFISAAIVSALGYMALPDCHHLYVDNAWREVAERAGVLHYKPELLIEHMHPAIGKAEWDEGHKRVNSQEMYSRDRAAFEAWKASGRASEDVRKVRQVLGRATITTR